MPSLSREFLQQLKATYTSYPCFIETGTLNGDTTFTMEPLFETLYTIEYSQHYYERTKSRYYGNKISFLHGDSSIVFEGLLPTISDRAIFFLDGHYSSGDTGQSVKDCPLIEEIQHINTLFRSEAIIIVDDVRLFGKSKATGCNEDWSDISRDKLLDILKGRTTDVYFLDSTCAKEDRMIIHIKAL